MHKLKYFGTDGIRGRVGKIPITPDFMLKLGWAIGIVFKRYGAKKIIIGKDTRISGYMIESSIKAGLISAGSFPIFAGSIPTPAVAYLTRIYKNSAGISISASHNPYYDNGIKLFYSNGVKLPKKIEQEIEIEIKKPITCEKSKKLGKTIKIFNAAKNYIEYCKSSFPKNQNLSNFKIVIDCGNGSTYKIAPSILNELGAKVIKIGCKPNGLNINYNCGITNIKILQQKVLKEKADIGIAFDGDGDRVIMVDHLGHKIDGDQILYIIAKDAFLNKKLKGGVVGTIMSNSGLEIALKKIGIPFVRTKVGDKYILSELKEKGWDFGAEKSGHVILLNKSTTCDGIITCLYIFSIIVKNNTNLYNLCKKIKLIPQIILNIYLSERSSQAINKDKIIRINKLKHKLLENGRILLRKSGTEPLIRIMIEGNNKKQIKKMAKYIEYIIKK